MIAEALKKALLQAAIQGKLTEQLPEDGDARELLKEIQKEKARLVKEGKLKKEKSLPEIRDDEIPFDIPENWVWARLQEISTINPRNQIPDDTVVSFVPMRLIGEGFKNQFTHEQSLWKDVKSGFTHFSDNDIVVAKITPCFENRKSVVMKGLLNSYGAGTTELYVIRPINDYIESEYLLFLLKTEYFISGGKLMMTGTAGQQRVGKKYIQEFMCPIAPLTEQKRIIVLINSLLNEIENLEEDEQKLDYIEREFPGKIRASILQAAIQGKLTEQLPEDGDVRDLLKEIQKEKARLIKEGKIKKEKPLPEITEDEIPFDIPENWAWCRLGTLVSIKTGSKDANWGSPAGTYRFFTCAKETILSETFSFEGKSIVMPGNGANVGESWLIDEKFEAYQRTYVLQGTSDDVYLEYVRTVLSSDWKKRYSGGVYGSAIPYIRLGELTDYIFPLPPLSEQKRIVKKLDELLPLCISLETTS